MLPLLRFDSFQCGFIPNSQAANGVYAIKRAAELSREWGTPFFIVQLDLAKAFDRVLHSAVVAALKLQGASLQCVAVLCAILSQSKAAVSLGHLKASLLELCRGLPQGAPESPLVFVLVTEFVLRPLLRKWQSNGDGWKLGNFYLSAICYADDILLISSSKASLTRMLADIVEAFAVVGLDVAAEKCHWTSFPSMTTSTLALRDHQLNWESHLTFVGTVLDVGGNDGRAIDYRIAQATKVFFKWRSILQCPNAPLMSRVTLFTKTVLMALLWLSETWYSSKRQRFRLESWCARMVARVCRLKRYGDEDMGDYWKRLHRTGRRWLRLCCGGANVCRRRRLHGFAGHISRAQDDSIAGRALRTRSLGWWRHFQKNNLIRHPRRFRPWRWESQLEDFYGQTTALFVDEDAGWMLLARDRAGWTAREQLFSSAL